MPMHERKRQAAVKLTIKGLQRDRKHLWARYRKEMHAAGYYDDHYWEAYYNECLRQDAIIRQELNWAAMQLPPYLVWRQDWGCLERVDIGY